ncbi:valine--tRNA ligase [Capnocytophaga felis]|uniref:Valine--tRNA ligase n=1 Tax=Capnocytophaga felis TaxID=2267611 RepID=A0A5M4BAS9_9FLAO|nr:valine--tRNA ligase [Capnocytophaga felis]GET46412.1 valine--tRNA ligase [Capnocytophaga felis]GET48301.1 valine--tRNA ligase [Capnocytophaga felis]
MEIPSKYLPTSVESKWYEYWMKYNFFHSTPDERTPYTIVIPPPNVTGILHMGHMLNNTIQDVLIRRARLKGFNACWVPGTDHASIATEAKVVAKLKEQGIDKADLSREEFLKHAWDWTHQYGGVILEQLKKLGCSCDWDRTKFTLDEDMYASVIKVFVDLYNKGYIYRGYRMVNWDPQAKTTLSDEEVIYKEQNGKLFYLKYYIVDENASTSQNGDFLMVATTRPETIFGDVAVCINPNDERYKHLKGKKVIVPIVNRVVPIIEDEYVDIEFGTGALKITPAHDKNDYEIGEKHKLEIIDAFTDEGKLNAYGLHYEGKDRFAVRKEIAKELEEKNLLEKVENYLNKVGTSERTGAVIEQRPLDQWFLKMEELVKPAISSVLENEEIHFFPKRYENTYRHWMENIRDWNISRQLWWGQQIPAYYISSPNPSEGGEFPKELERQFVVAENEEEARKLAIEKFPILAEVKGGFYLRQDEDALDTWFSSWLWPMSVFGGILNPDNEEYKYYYPTNDLVTGPDIIFFWVARMIMAGYEFKGKKPFTNVYFTGIVRDKQGRKMSKSLGNSPDALKLIDDFGADGVRVGLLLSSAAGNDLLFDEALCQQGSGFANKIWNAFRLVKGWEISEANQSENKRIAIEWYRNKFQKVLAETEDDFAKYRISDALMKIYKLVWDDFCSWLLEMVKPAYGQPIDQKTFAEIIAIFEDNLKLLHPFMPFITEEIWQHITERKPQEALVVAKYPEITSFDEQILAEFDTAAEVISGIRTVRKEKNIPFKEEMPLSVLNNEQTATTFDVIIAKLGNLSELKYVIQKVEGAISFRVKSNEYFIPLSGSVNVEEEIKKLEEELKYTQGFLASVEKKLSNEKFVSSAPEKVVEMERKKQADALAKIETIQESLKNLRG